MAWALQFGNTVGYCHFNYSLSGESDFVIEVKIAFEDTLGRFTILSDANWDGNNVFVWGVLTSNPYVQLRTSAGDIRLDVDFAFTLGVFYTLRVTRSGTAYTLHVDGVLKDTVVSSEVFTGGFIAIGKFPGTLADKAKIEYLSVTGTISNDVYLDATASDHVPGTVTWLDTVSGNNATGANMPTDGSAWVDLGGGGITAAVAEAGPSFAEVITSNLDVNISASISESGPSFSDVINVDISSLTIQGDISESGPSFVESINLSITKEVQASITESGPSFVDSIFASIPIKITVNQKNIVRVKRKSNTVIIKRRTNTIRVK